ncbi:GNAT family N-acetyltransferase [Leucobacter sp. CSA2]|uniref:GNAT family N-acetyltransferase n=1 Tax=Leucobacter edaphi TaxID=2796472 RepID=A0A934UXC2_9MICO|nr:GNAT family protein [Leucobacter edaphi]MBK0421865.1 GNAT family N-acetyltransferase [Leucobacter edaphi]
MALEHPGTLRGRIVTLEPLSLDHLRGLQEAARDGELWKLWYTSVPEPAGMAAEIRRRLELQERGSMIPFAARRNDTGAIIGMTTFMNIDAATPRVEIGSTWNGASAHGSGTNPESKLLLLDHAFTVWGCPAVEFRTDFHNHQSRAAIARLGAKQDGILRSHLRRPAGYVRDTVVFSIIASEWPGVRIGLERRVAAHLPDGEDPGRLG